jgi:hypothetical protein
MTFRQLEIPMETESHAWYLNKLDARYVVESVVLEEDFLVLLRVHRTETPSVNFVLYVPLYGRIVEDVYVDENDHVRVKGTDRLLA